jgi:hypothetical protein
MTLKPTVQEWLQLMSLLRYTIDVRPNSVNIVGFRNKLVNVDKFEDTIATFSFNGKYWTARYYAATTRPGLPKLLKPVNPKGAAIIVPGQYKDVYQLGGFRGYMALRQVGQLRVYRDNNKDSQFDHNSATIESGHFGIHIHKAGIWSKLVGQNSAGCQVFQKAKDYEEFMNQCSAVADKYGNKFTYTLLEI